MIHWVQLIMQPGQQRAISAPASSSCSPSSAKRPAAALSNSHSSEVKALTSKLDKVASAVKQLAAQSSSDGKRPDRSRSPRGPKNKRPANNSTKGGEGKAKGGALKGNGKGTRFGDLMKQHRDKFETGKKFVTNSRMRTAQIKVV